MKRIARTSPASSLLFVRCLCGEAVSRASVVRVQRLARPEDSRTESPGL